MILGRNAGLWAATAAAIVNVAATLGVVSLPPEAWSALNAALFAVIGLIANEADPTTAATFAPTIRGPGTGSE